MMFNRDTNRSGHSLFSQLVRGNDPDVLCRSDTQVACHFGHVDADQGRVEHRHDHADAGREQLVQTWAR